MSKNEIAFIVSTITFEIFSRRLTNNLENLRPSLK